MSGSTQFIPFESKARETQQEDLLKSYRLVVTKEQRKDGQVNIFTNEACNYHAIITNEMDLTEDEVVCFYNQRGAIEKEFDVLKNDFGWQNLPFSKLEQNTVFLIFTAICRNLYALIITSFSKKFQGLSSTFRIKKFIYRFVTVPAKWVQRSRQWKLRLYGQLCYKT